MAPALGSDGVKPVGTAPTVSDRFRPELDFEFKVEVLLRMCRKMECPDSYVVFKEQYLTVVIAVRID